MERCAAILSGGLGTRLRSVVNDRPKVMAPVAGRPFLTYLLDQLADAGIERVVLCTGYLAANVLDELGSGYRGMRLVHSVEETPLGTGGALGKAAPLFSGETLLVLNGDSYCQCDLADFARGFAASGACAGMVLNRVPDVARFGAVVTDGASRVVEFVEKGDRQGPGWINAGIYLLPTALLEEIGGERTVSLEREIFPTLLERGLHGHRCHGAFIDIGVPEEYRRAQTFFQPRSPDVP